MIRIVDALTPFEDAGLLDPLDVSLARGLVRMAEGAVEKCVPVALGVALASRATALGHLCADLQTAHDLLRAEVSGVDRPPGTLLDLPPMEEWLAALRKSPLVRTPEEDRATPLVLDPRGRLYLDRYWQFEMRLFRGLRERLSRTFPIEPVEETAQLLRDLIPCPPDRPDLLPGVLGQRLAVLLALRGSLTILTGGPGTGKTTTVAAMILAWMHQARGREHAEDRPRNIWLMAPTGKAAARLAESIRRFREVRDPVTGSDPLPPSLAPLLESLPREAFTIHRALKAHPDRLGPFGHHAGAPLPASIVVVDEASMVDAALMARLMDALEPDTRLILVGDQDQLASVEAGAILGDLCGTGVETARRVPTEVATLARTVVGANLSLETSPAAPPIAGAIARLHHSFRFQPDSGIGEVARAIRDLGSRTGSSLEEGVDRVLGLFRSEEGELRAGRRDWVRWIALGPEDPIEKGVASRRIREEILEGWNGVLEGVQQTFSGAIPRERTIGNSPDAGDAPRTHREAVREAIEAMNAFRVLCIHRQGPRGVEEMNRWICNSLARRHGLRGTWFVGCPILILQNDYHLGLFNGDVGMVLPDESEGESRLRAWFLDPDRQPRGFDLGRLPPHEKVFAMTVHKSQGSEFQKVVVLLPARDSEFVSRELIYTAITRASGEVLLVGSREGLRSALKRRVQRASGLQDRLWGAGEPPPDG